MYGIIGFLRDGVKKPINSLLFSWGIERVVVGNLGDQFFKKVNVGGDVGAMDMAEVFDCCAK